MYYCGRGTKDRGTNASLNVPPSVLQPIVAVVNVIHAGKLMFKGQKFEPLKLLSRAGRYQNLVNMIMN